MRLPFLLILMAATACCAPNFPKGQQPEECASPGEITQTELNVALNETLPGYVIPHTVANVTDGRVVCSYDNPVIVYIDNNRTMKFTIGKMECAGGMWHVADDKESIEHTRVCYMGPQYKEKKPEPEKPKKCDSPGEIAKAELDTKFKGQKYAHSPVTDVNGTVICSPDTQVIAYFVNQKKMKFTKEIVCKAGKWHVADHETLLEDARAACIDGAVVTPKIH